MPGIRTADVGSGTGHNAEIWRKQLGILVDEYDVADLHWVGPGPALFDGEQLPAVQAPYEAMTLLFVLQYACDPARLLRHLAERCEGPILLMQSTYRGGWGRWWLAIREWITGWLSLQIARRAGVLGGDSCPLIPRRFFSRFELRRTLKEAELVVDHWKPSEWWGLSISRDLYVLHSTRRSPKFPLLSPHAMKNVG
jgi:hypothetical protein